MRRHFPLLALILFACAASFGPVVFRSWVLQHDIDGGGHTFSNAVFVGDGSGLTGISGGSSLLTTNESDGLLLQTSPASNPGLLLYGSAGGGTAGAFQALLAEDASGGSTLNIYSPANSPTATLKGYTYGGLAALMLMQGGTADANVFALMDPSQDNGFQPFRWAAKANLSSSQAHTVWRDSTNTVDLMTLWGNGAITIAGTTNQVTFGGTNTAPVSAVAAAKWISVQVTGYTNAYRIPLYE